jgi:hypothetical protein
MSVYASAPLSSYSSRLAASAIALLFPMPRESHRSYVPVLQKTSFPSKTAAITADGAARRPLLVEADARFILYHKTSRRDHPACRFLLYRRARVGSTACTLQVRTYARTPVRAFEEAGKHVVA